MKSRLSAKVFPLFLTAALILSCTTVNDLVRQERLNEAAEAVSKLPAAQRADGYATLGGAYAKRGDYAKAVELYAKARDTSALERLAAELLEKGEYDLFFACRREADKKTLVLEEFQDNSRGWNVRSDDYIKASISAGRLLADRHAEKGTSYLWMTCAMDPAKDFRIEAVVTKVSGKDNNAFSVAWGMEDAGDNFQFGYSGDGHYRYAAVEDGETDQRISWTETGAVRRGNAANVIAVEKTGDTVGFFINGERVDDWRFEGFAGNRVGISISPQSVIEVDDFAVYEYPSARGPWAEISAAAAKKGQYPAALKYAFKSTGGDGLRAVAPDAVRAGQTEAVRAALVESGLSERAARIRLASFMQDVGKSREAVEELLKAGWDLSKGFVFPLAAEDFKDNSMDWSVDDTEDAALAVRDGKYYFEKKKTGGWHASWNNLDLSPDADYRIGVTMKKISGADDRTYSVLWGLSDMDNCVDFGLLGSGKIQYGYFVDDEWHSLIPTTASDAVRKGNAENRVSVAREGGVLRLSVNGTEVGRSTQPDVTGGKVGFALYQKMAVVFDDLEVVEYAPAFALRLAKDVVFASNPSEYARLAAAMQSDRMEGMKAAAPPAAAVEEAPDYEALGAQAEAAGNALAAVEYYSKAGNKAKISALSLKAAAQAADAKNWSRAVELYKGAGESEEAYAGLAAAYAALGKKEEAEAAREKLANRYFAKGEKDLARENYLTLTAPARLDAAGAKYLAAGDYEEAAELFKLSGNLRKEKECYRAQAAALDKAGDLEEAIPLYEKAGDAAAAKGARGRLADRLAANDEWEDALALYKALGNTAKAADMNKKLSAVTVLSGKSAKAGEEIRLNTTIGIVGVPETVTAPKAADARVTITGIERSAVRTKDGDKIVTFTIRLKGNLPADTIPTLYFDAGEHFVMYMFDPKNVYSTSSQSGNFTVSWKDEEDIGFRGAGSKTLQCDVELKKTHYDTGSYRTVTDFDLAGMKCALTVFMVEGADVWSYVPMGAGRTERETYNAVSNVFQTNVSF